MKISALFFDINNDCKDALTNSIAPNFIFAAFAVKPSNIFGELKPTKNVVCATNLIARDARAFFVPFPAVTQFCIGIRRAFPSYNFKQDCIKQNKMELFERPAKAVFDFAKIAAEIIVNAEQFPDCFLFLPPLAVLNKTQILSLVKQPRRNIDNYIARIRNDIPFFKANSILPF